MRRMLANTGGFLLLLLVGTTPGWGSGDPPDPCLELARKLQEIGACEEAITEYKRHLFLHPDDPNRDEHLREIARAYRDLDQVEEARLAFRKAAAEASNDSVREQRRVDEALMQMAMGRYDAADFQLSRVAAFGKDPAARERAAFLQTVSRIRTHRWEQARISLASTSPSWRKEEHRKVDSLLALAAKAPRLSPGKARLLSTLIPGAGQIYAGRPLEGVHSFLLNLGFGSLLAKSIAEREYGLALVLYLPFFYRYYRGSRYHAARIAEERNRAMQNAWSDRIVSRMIGGEP